MFAEAVISANVTSMLLMMSEIDQKRQTNIQKPGWVFQNIVNFELITQFLL